MKKIPVFLIVLAFAVVPVRQAEGQDKVVATIAPLHSLVAGVAEGVDKVGLIVPAETSPHDFALRPSHIRKMSGAKAVFHIGGGFEHFMRGALDSLPPEVRKVPVGEKSGIKLLKTSRNASEPHGHGRHDGHGHHDEHEHHEHGRGLFDMHLWLSPENARKIVKTVERELSQMSPEHRSAYRKNARKLTKKLKKLDAKIRKTLAGTGEKPYAVFHDAYIYFERDYGLKVVGSVAVNPEIPLSAGRIRKIRAEILKTGAVCVFSEPQFGESAADAVVEGTDVKTGSLDPLGAGLEPGPGLYFEMMENLAREVKRCLG